MFVDCLVAPQRLSRLLETVTTSLTRCLEKAARGGGMILSFGGGVSPGKPPENIDALLAAAREWRAMI